jgi:nucleobase:cation symporter-1, NCS1 family
VSAAVTTHAAATTGEEQRAFELERHGFDFIPEDARHMTLKDLASVWVGANAYLFFFSVGVIAFSLGLNVWQSILAVVVGNCLFAYVSWASIAGPRAGLPTMTLTRAPFGIHGNRFNAVMAWVTSVSFEALNTVFGVFAVAALLPVLGWDNSDTAGKIIGLVLVFFLSAVIAVLGHATLVYFQRIFAIALTLVLVGVFFYTVGGVDWSAGPKDHMSTGATLAALTLGIAVVASGPLSYLFNSSDWSRYLPGRTDSKSIFWTVMWSSSLIAIFLGFMGAILSSRGDMSDPVGGLRHLIPDWLFVIYALAAIGGAVANNLVTFYASGLTLQSAGVPLRRYQATLLDMVVSTVLVIYVVFISESFLTVLNDFLSLLIVWIAPFGGVWLVDSLLRRYHYDPVDVHAVAARGRGRYWFWNGINVKGFVAMLIGAGVCMLTVNAPIYTGPISDAVSGADFAWLLGLPVAGAVYYTIARKDVIAARDVPLSHIKEAELMGEETAIHEGVIGADDAVPGGVAQSAPGTHV